MKKFFQKNIGILAFIVAVIVCLSFLMYTVSLVTEYSSGFSEQAMERSEFYTQEQTSLLLRAQEKVQDSAKDIAARLSTLCRDRDDFKQETQNLLSAENGDPNLLDILYVKDGVLYFANGDVCSEYPEMTVLAETSELWLSRMFQYQNRTMAIAASALSPCELFDGIVAVFDRTVISLSESVESESSEAFRKAEFSLLCKHDGKITDRIENSEEFDIGNPAVGEGILRTLFEESSEVNDVLEAMNGDRISSFPFSIGSEEYILSVSPFGVSESGLSLLCVYRVGNIYGTGFAVMQNITATLLGLALIMGVLIVMMIVTRIRQRRTLYELEMLDPSLHCPTEKKFIKRSEELLRTHVHSDFAQVSLKINNFGYVREHFGDNAAQKLLRFTVDSVRGALLIEEAFGYAGDGEFLLLLQYRERKSFSERLNGLYLRLSSFRDFEEENYQVSIAFSVYEMKHESERNVRDGRNKLKITKEASAVRSGFFSVNYYEDMMYQEYIRKAEIEGSIEQALQNSEFHLFYQPKYNLKTKNMAGCEILIRWYDPEQEKYRVPAEFLPVFEENLFIVKLDHFVFFKACENIAKTVERKQICYPVSVNVSRVTATRPDFVDYYVRIKKKFGIKDGFLTLEFTESFAYENYEFLSDIVQKLHDNGFLCSIDDFGTGYSSYNILKSIPMDEIKLDKFFLDQGLSAERDQLLLQSVIDMVKALGMTVTQEGVESKEDLYRLEKLGCDIIQGYYFAKPMKYTDYCDFVKNNFA